MLQLVLSIQMSYPVQHNLPRDRWVPGKIKKRNSLYLNRLPDNTRHFPEFNLMTCISMSP